ncbi:septal ring lytic transglycosylase RlpA family protein [Arenibaculum sp.]|jgi:rare lipoprotein A|uniref:septal ring lytic transglycosylase RlpA family protein n=1 Tax=Arenibaculum sp. TaxID=2865862 RepID=UPI002E0EF314|nr:septal ring lytic transglycosylase RlpA family protein [Arenibaculum sp.]
MPRKRTPSIQAPVQAALLAAFALLAASPAQAEEEPHVETGTASWYGPGFEGRPTASGEPMRQNRLTAAHPSLPLDTTAKVTNLENGQSVEVKINDRGPFVEGRVIDLSRAAAERLDMTEDGTAPVRVEAEPAADEDG